MCELAERLPLQVLSLSGIPHLTDRGILALANSQPQLHELYISGCTKISQQAVNYITVRAIVSVRASTFTPEDKFVDAVVRNVFWGVVTNPNG